MRALCLLVAGALLVLIGAVPVIAEHIGLLVELAGRLALTGAAELLAQPAVAGLLLAVGLIQYARTRGTGRAAV